MLGEWTASTTGGLGVYLLEQNSRLNTAGVFAAILLLSAIGIVGFLLVAGAEKLATPWRTRPTPRRLPFGGARARAPPPQLQRPSKEAAHEGPGRSRPSRSGRGARACRRDGGTRSPPRAASKLTTMRMVQEWPVADGFWIPWIVARDKGWYKAAGIDLQIIPPPTVADTVKFLGTGRADIGFTTILDVIFAKAQNAPIVVDRRLLAVEQLGPDRPPGREVHRREPEGQDGRHLQRRVDEGAAQHHARAPRT